MKKKDEQSNSYSLTKTISKDEGGQIRFESGLKINISVYRALRLLQILCDSDGLNFEVIAQALSDDPLVHKTFHEETINNYLHTLKRSGLKWKRPHVANGLLYKLTERFILTQWRSVDLLAIKHLLRHVDTLPSLRDQWIARNCLETWLDEAEVALGNKQLDTKLNERKKRSSKSNRAIEPNDLSDNIDENLMVQELQEAAALSPESQAFIKKIALFSQYCRDEQWLTVELDPASSDFQHKEETGVLIIWVEPYELMMKEDVLCLWGYVKEWDELCQIPLQAILSVQQEPGKSRKTIQPVTVTFKLTGRLASSYRQYPGERLLEEGEGEILVEAKTLDLDHLTKRLMKYHTQCEVISPGYVRQKMKQQIERLLGIEN